MRKSHLKKVFVDEGKEGSGICEAPASIDDDFDAIIWWEDGESIELDLHRSSFIDADIK